MKLREIAVFLMCCCRWSCNGFYLKKRTITRHVNRYVKEISLVRILCAMRASQQLLMDEHFSSVPSDKCAHKFVDVSTI